MKLFNQGRFAAVFTIFSLATVVSQATAGITVSTNATGSSSKSLSETSALERELQLARQALASTSARLRRLQSAARSGRKKAEEAATMLKQIRSVENQIGRLEKQLGSLSKIPQLRMLKPLVTSLKSLKKQIYEVRLKADKARKDAIEPAAKKIKEFEIEVAKVVAQIKQAEAETKAATQQLVSLKNYVVANGYRKYEVTALESMARTMRAPITPMRKSLSDIDASSADAEKKINAYAKALSSLTKLKPGIDKLKKDLSPIDKKARDLDKVLSKRIGFKVPIVKKNVSFTVRQVIESPGKVLDIAVKPLTAIANKLLSPITKKFKINIKAPSEIREISKKLDSLRSQVLNLTKAKSAFQNAAKSRAVSNYRTAMNRLKRMTGTQLGR